MSRILQKKEIEVDLMLKRNCIQDKRKKKKTDIDKKRIFLTGLIEKELKSQNILKMTEDDLA